MRSSPGAAELFTSQGCSSCPPADALFARLPNDPIGDRMTRPVNPSDRLGWRGAFAREENSSLQRAYTALLLRHGDAGPILAARYL